ncbi:MAG: hypothetical protein WB988_08510 [Candidatus Nitrosopolaris sp.]|jgi:hypothetical protein
MNFTKDGNFIQDIDIMDVSTFWYLTRSEIFLDASLTSAVSLLQFSSVKGSLRIQSGQQIYARVIETRMKLENTEAFTKMAKENEMFAERLALVDSPDEYYTVVAYLDLIEFLFHLHETKMIVLGSKKGVKKHDSTAERYPLGGVCVFIIWNL